MALAYFFFPLSFEKKLFCHFTIQLLTTVQLSLRKRTDVLRLEKTAVTLETLRLLATLIRQTLNYIFWQVIYWIYIKPFQNMYILSHYKKKHGIPSVLYRRAYQLYTSPVTPLLFFSVDGKLHWRSKAQ